MRIEFTAPPFEARGAITVLASLLVDNQGFMRSGRCRASPAEPCTQQRGHTEGHIQSPDRPDLMEEDGNLKLRKP